MNTHNQCLLSFLFIFYFIISKEIFETRNQKQQLEYLLLNDHEAKTWTVLFASLGFHLNSTNKQRATNFFFIYFRERELPTW